ncbi:hypothetical protein DFQ04_1670 [Algoriphagus boseongensis]|uniref:Uncharacterized protein n=1 Tax=Algoriphagus boseongensis TaxID=1442587 RepID=A0A4R6T5U2_9BACT|nr:DUF6090 family protein [Algoriphagus boseongensis]TDQ17022.1 hypothetical protein DFQ04_1670 [Algoriphagus boseongensis]
MLSFFRKIRQKLLNQHRITQYLAYAAGEILLVMIGILLALQVNNWNEARKTKLTEEAILKNLVQDLTADSISYQSNLAALAKINALHQVLYEIGVKGMDLEIENPNAIRLLILFNPVAMENDPFVASKISNESIRKEILNYSRTLKDLEETYAEFKELVENRIRIFLADQKVHQLSKWFEGEGVKVKGEITFDFIDKADLILLSKTPEFQQLIFEASVKSKNTEFILREVLSQNQKLKEVIQNELK